MSKFYKKSDKSLLQEKQYNAEMVLEAYDSFIIWRKN